ncbi:MAG: MBL fold metallo-hydrolase [Brachymonas sp.]
MTGAAFYARTQSLPTYLQSPQFVGERFSNVLPRPARGLLEGAGLWYDFLFNKPAGTLPDRIIPVQAITRAGLLAAADNSVWRLGHSTLLFKLHGKFWLTDPVFSERASPVQWFGPKRWHAPPISIDELPPIEAVVLSHDHYDHLDHAAVLALQDKVAHFIAPLGVGTRLVDWGVPAAKVQELDWWQHTVVNGVRLTATPAQHFSGRGLNDGNRTLWVSWVITGAGFNLFFSGDSGYFDGFKEIGRRHGPFDVAFLETGAYNKRWEYVHMLPEQTVQAFQDLGAKWLFPIHNGTFDLAMHAWNDPFEQISRLAGEQGIALSTPEMGEPLPFLSPHAGRAWWRDPASSTNGEA